MLPPIWAQPWVAGERRRAKRAKFFRPRVKCFGLRAADIRENLETGNEIDVDELRKRVEMNSVDELG
jgi:hypothetical protein